MRRRIGFTMGFAFTTLLGGPAAHALTVPFTEDFPTDNAGWLDNASQPLSWVASGGPDGSSFASGTFNFFGFESPFGGGPVVFRGPNASDGNFEGDWIAGGVTVVSAFVRHDAPADLTYFLRVAADANFPGAVIRGTQAVSAGAWTEIRFAIDPESSLCIGEGVTCAQALSNVGRIQLGTDAPAALTDLDRAIVLDVDKISVVPEPGTLALTALGLAGLAAYAARRSRAPQRAAPGSA